MFKKIFKKIFRIILTLQITVIRIIYVWTVAIVVQMYKRIAHLQVISELSLATLQTTNYIYQGYGEVLSLMVFDLFYLNFSAQTLSLNLNFIKRTY